MKTCSVENCKKRHLAKGFCDKHYRQVEKHGHILKRTTKDPNEFWFDDDICFIQIYDKECKPKCVAMVDKKDYSRVKKYKWAVQNDDMVINNTIGLLSRFITNTTNPDIQVDHKNHNRLDNRRQNLRPCTPAQNSSNTCKPSTNTSGFKGVSWDKSRKKWAAYITFQLKRINLGRFDVLEEAVCAYNEAAIQYHGEFAYLNELN